MKTSIKVAFAALTIAALTFEGCKKGENDPFLSLRSRKARLAGEWKVSSGEGTIKDVWGTRTWTYDGATLTTNSSLGSSTQSITMTYEFEKDGTYKTVTTSTSGNNTQTITETGTWNFTAGVGDAKSKDHVVMYTLTSTETDTNPASTSTMTYTGDNAPVQSMYIDELKNKEVIFKWDGSTTPGANGADTDSGSYTLTPQ